MKHTLHATLATLLTAVLVAPIAATAQPSYTLGGFVRAPDTTNSQTPSFNPVGGLEANHRDGSQWFGPGAILTSEFGASRSPGTFTSGLVTNDQDLDGGTDPWYARTDARSFLSGDVLSFEGFAHPSASTYVTFGYRFTSQVDVSPADATRFGVQSNVRATLYTLSATSDTLNNSLRRQIGYSYQHSTMAEFGFTGGPTAILNGTVLPQAQPLRFFTYEGTINVLITPAFNRVRIHEVGAQSNAAVNAVTGPDGDIHGAQIFNQIDFWIEGFGQPTLRLAGSLTGHDYAYVPASPIPEPGSALLLAAGLMVVGLWRRGRAA